MNPFEPIPRAPFPPARGRAHAAQARLHRARYRPPVRPGRRRLPPAGLQEPRLRRGPGPGGRPGQPAGKSLWPVPEGKALSAGFDGNALPEAASATRPRRFPPGGWGALCRDEGDRRRYVKNGFPPDLVEAAKRREIADAEFRKNSVGGLAAAWSQALAVEGRLPGRRHRGDPEGHGRGCKPCRQGIPRQRYGDHGRPDPASVRGPGLRERVRGRGIVRPGADKGGPGPRLGKEDRDDARPARVAGETVRHPDANGLAP